MKYATPVLAAVASALAIALANAQGAHPRILVWVVGPASRIAEHIFYGGKRETAPIAPPSSGRVAAETAAAAKTVGTAPAVLAMPSGGGGVFSAGWIAGLCTLS